MQALVLYDSKFGHTEQLARAIGDALGREYTARVFPVTHAPPFTRQGIDLLVIGGPTHAHGMSAPMKALLSELHRGDLAGVVAATFDTRFHMARLLSGSAARSIAQRLERAGCRMLAPPESFFVERER